MAAFPRLARDGTRAWGRARGHARVSARSPGEPRLDPVRWRRPGAGTLIRLIVVAALLSVAAMLLWSGPIGSGRLGGGRSSSGAASGSLSGAAACVARPGDAGPLSAAGSDPERSGAERAASGAGPPSGGPATASGPATATGQPTANGQATGSGPAAASGPAGGGSSSGGVHAAAGAPGISGEPSSSAGDATGGADSGGAAVPVGNVGVPVRLADPTALAMVHAGDRVDLLRVDESGNGTSPVAADALVLSVTRSDDVGSGGLLLALRPADAAKAAAPGRGFAVLVRPS